MLRVAVVTLFPEFFGEPLGVSILGRAAAKGLVEYRVVRLRDYTHDRHQTADDEPYGGGAGMVLRPEPFFEAVNVFHAGASVVRASSSHRFVHMRAAMACSSGPTASA